MIGILARFSSEDEGQDLIEYALLAALISMVSIAAISALGSTINTLYLGPLQSAVTAAGS